MDKARIRINNISINNVKNVLNGSVFLDETGVDTFGASIVGIYGQNGSGKTALVWAVELIKTALSGEQLPNDAYFYIGQNSKTATVNVEFSLNINNREYSVFYTIVIQKKDDENIHISFEKLEYSAKADLNSPKIYKTKILGIEYPGNGVEVEESLFFPETRISEMCAVDKQIRQKLLVSQVLSNEKKTSFIFNDKMSNIFKTVYPNHLNSKIIETLMFYARMNLFVLNKNSDTLFNMNLLPLSMRLATGEAITKSDRVPVGLGQNVSDVETYNTICKIISQIDILLESIIPGLHVKVYEKMTQLNEKAEEQVVFELISNRNGTITPLRYESEGIKKILCILSSLIAMYNNDSVFVAIDEMDAGIFEYLLGEILDIINKTGKGQLLFTSHNMRPLEVLDNNHIYFTTVNPNNKYIQFTGIKPNNNLRTTLLRTIDLGGQKESIYEHTSSYQIGKAFRKAGVFTNE